MLTIKMNMIWILMLVLKLIITHVFRMNATMLTNGLMNKDITNVLMIVTVMVSDLVLQTDSVKVMLDQKILHVSSQTKEITSSLITLIINIVMKSLSTVNVTMKENLFKLLDKKIA
jgi:hypothetical protein